MRMRLDWLETFVAIAESGSLTVAGERVARSQSAVSLQLRQLEDAVGARLFDRGPRHVALTAAGERLRPWARRALEAADGALGAAVLDEPRSVRIGVPEEYADGVIPELLAGLARGHGGVAVELQCAESAVLERRLAAGRLDLAFALADEVERRGEAVATDPTDWLCARGFDAARRPLPVAVFDQACSWRRRALEALEAAAIDYRVVFTSASVAGVRAGIRAGLAAGAIGRATASDDLEPLPAPAAPPALPASELVLLRAAGGDAVVDELGGRARERLRRALAQLARLSHRCAQRGREDARQDKAREGSGAQAYLNSTLSTRTERNAGLAGRFASAAVDR
ncbi:MAG: LysR substrate-binding domain-containing protein [Halofilum sp. (in: g-proteobacteria)]|nr:LysR substrate-binding domain-containing protein [Halofilum sp. (in: g-proteobacteria)]